MRREQEFRGRCRASLITATDSVTDTLTRFMWTRNASTPMPPECSSSFGVTTSWLNAFSYIDCLNTNNYLGHNDWKLPNREELFSLTSVLSLPSGNPFSNVPVNYQWSSTSMSMYPNAAWGRHGSLGALLGFDKSSTVPSWPMRDLNWRVYSVLPSESSCIDWRVDQHPPLCGVATYRSVEYSIM